MKLRSIELPPRAEGLSRTLVLFHGYGADEHDLLPLAHELDPRLRAVSLAAPLSLGQGRAWTHLRQDLSFDPAQALEAARLALEAVEHIAAGSPRPILLGFSQGAAVALSVALAKPALVHCVLSLSGVPPALGAAGADQAAALRGLPVFVAHGTQDPLLPIALGRKTAADLRALGLDVTFREYPMAHSVSIDEIRDARQWLVKHL